MLVVVCPVVLGKDIKEFLHDILIQVMILS